MVRPRSLNSISCITENLHISGVLLTPNSLLGLFLGHVSKRLRTGSEFQIS